jgi:CubicO group peptidase (beta-lactamase class C family)
MEKLIKNILILLLIAVLLSMPGAASATPAPVRPGQIDLAALDRYITAQMDKHGLKGISLAITQGEEILYLKGYGTAGGGRSMSPQTPMYIGSQSKSFTALAVAQLAEQGKIDPAATVQSYLPWFKVADPLASQKITVNHLLHHTSGLSESGFTLSLPENATNAEAARALAYAKLTAPVGGKFQYFNVGYDVLAVIVEAASGQPYEEYIQEHIFDPLGMTRTFTGPEPARAQGLSQGYSRFFGFTVPRRQPHRIFEVSAGYIISTAEDMAHFAMAMNNDGEYNGVRILSREWMHKLFVPVQGYGMGWFVEPNHIYHGGANETFKTFVDLYPRKDLGLVLLINQGYMLDHYISATQVFNGVSSIALGSAPPPVSSGLSVRTIGWGILALVLALTVLHTRNFLSLRGWRARARSWPAAKRAWDVAVSFLIPTLILGVVFWQIKNFYGYRFNLTYQLSTMFTTLPDISILMLVGSLPDYIQGLIKLYWVATGQTRKGEMASLEVAAY